MEKRIITLAVLAVFVFTFVPGAAWASGLNNAVSIDFKDADIRDVFKILGAKADCNIITEKSVRGNITIRAKDVPVIRLARQIAAANGFIVVVDGNTLILTDERRVPVISITRAVRNMGAADATKAIVSAFRKDLRMAVVEDSNSVIITGRPDMVNEAEKLLASIDRPRPDVRALVQLKREGRVLREFELQAAFGNENQMNWISRKPVEKLSAKPLKTLPEISFVGITPEFIDGKGRLHGFLSCHFNLPGDTVGVKSDKGVKTSFIAESGKPVTVARFSGDETGLAIVLTLQYQGR
ncbi:MAG TPA: secretin N-terminal domain-containing protein [Candidatus Ozemobacteraceae bacterium]|nr:secretin N-terminal domain-containing protein [Candidatus Ozemobacteraceae bacterium]